MIYLMFKVFFLNSLNLIFFFSTYFRCLVLSFLLFNFLINDNDEYNMSVKKISIKFDNSSGTGESILPIDWLACNKFLILETKPVIFKILN
jgi:hypothetical protein